ncbi:glycine oxidase [Arenicella chitinivorans]|uniref:Glycine oxidase n=1 Tax=Arenicella chitinivorans TaxID=1329800 RepID=A0A918RP68_9GAMM|nr:FAD-binding oxidoreductase [Arenicella chitinivorans]GHA03858.1 glycine oxidase [Arenicella chitinivorans]
MSAPQLDFLIVGQGLAGSILALNLRRHGKSVLVIDNDHCGSASQVAAGLINPVTGHRLNLTENFDHYWPVANAFYQSFGQLTGRSVHRDVTQYRRIKHPGQLTYLNKRLQQREYQSLLSRHIDSPFLATEPHSCIEVHQTSAVDTPTLLSQTKSMLLDQRAYSARKFNYHELSVNHDGVSAHGIRAGTVIFCEGYQAIHNPWLSTLPFKLAKGEILDVELSAPLPGMLSWGSWLIPSSTDTVNARLGANYDWQDLSLDPTPEIAQKLQTSLHQHTGLKAQVTAHQTGIRPTTKQRRPFIGPTRSLDHAYCFNGFGSKGCLTIPYYANLLCDHLISGKPLPEELTEWL